MGTPDWKTRPLRMVRFDRLGEMLPADPQALADHARQVADEMHANLEWVMATPGSAPGLAYLANFQTSRFEVNPAIGDQDPIRTYVPLAHDKGIAVFGYLNLHWYSYAFTDAHPDWEQRLASGQGYGRVHPLYGDGTTLCVNSGWREFAFGMAEEAMKTGLDGVFLDGPVVYPGCCYCEACRGAYRQLHDAEPPAEEDWDDPLWKAFLTFRETSMARFMKDMRTTVRAVNPEGGVFCNAGNWPYGNAVARNPWELEAHQDITAAEAFFHPRRATMPDILDSAQAAKFLRAGKNPAVVFTHHCLGAWHYRGMPDLEMKRAFYQTAACGAGNWLAVFGPALEHQGARTIRTVADSYGFLACHEELLTGTESMARTALVHSQATSLAYLSPRVGAAGQVHERDLIMHAEEPGIEDLAARKRACDQLCSDEFSGFFYALTRNHVPFDVIRDIDLRPELLTRYDTVVLPNIACLAPAWRQALVAFARSGGTVIASFETGHFDETGDLADGLDEARHPADGSNEAGQPAPGSFLRTLFGVARVEGDFAPAAAEEYLEISAAGAGVLDGLVEGELVPRFRLALKLKPAVEAQDLCHLMEPIGQVYRAPGPRSPYPGILVHPLGSGHGVVLAGTFGETYHSFGFLEYEQILHGLLHRLPGASPQITTDAPSTVQMELWRKGDQVLVHLVNNSGDMHRPMGSIHPVPQMTIGLRGVEARQVCSARGAQVAREQTPDGSSLRLGMSCQYDILVIDT